MALVAGNRLEFLEVVLGLWRAGHVYTPLKTGWTATEIGVVLDDARTALVVTDRPAAREAALARGLPVIDLDDDFEGWLGRQSNDVQPADRCGWKLPYTSGTTGRPKGVVPVGAGTVPFADAFRRTASLAELVRLPGEGVHLFVSRLFHGAPLTFGLGALARGARLRILTRWDASVALDMLSDGEVTSTTMVPTMFRQLLALRDVDRSPPPAPGLRTLLHGGEPCPLPLKRAMLDWFGPVLVEYYGFTEGGMTVADSTEWLARPGTVGRSMPGLSMRILDDAGTSLPPRCEGTVAFAADTGATFSYLRDPERTDAARVGDAFTVGDIGWADEQGYLYISGRRADVIVSGGVNVYPAEVEEALTDVPGIRDLCAVGGPDPVRGEAVVLFVAIDAGADEDDVRRSVDARARERLAAYKQPQRIVVSSDIPRDDTGKLLRAALRAPLWEGAEHYAASAPDMEE